MSTDPATFRCSAACNLFFSFFLFSKESLGTVFMTLHDPEPACLNYDPYSICMEIFLQVSCWFNTFASGSFRCALCAQTDPRSLHVERERVTPALAPYTLIKTDRRTPAQTTTVDVQARVSAFTNHTLSSFIAGYCESS